MFVGLGRYLYTYFLEYKFFYNYDGKKATFYSRIYFNIGNPRFSYLSGSGKKYES